MGWRLVSKKPANFHIARAWFVPTRFFSLALAVLLPALLAACAPPKTVYIPHEWQTQPPPSPQSQTPQAGSPQAAGPRAQAPPPVEQGPVLKPPPAIKESDLTESPGAPAPGKKASEQQPPQRLASMHLVDQGKAALNQGKANAAIPLFEQAVQVDVYNGEAFFGLARCWRMKGALSKALEFARKAEILFQDQPAKLKQVYTLQADIYKEMGDLEKMESYRQKASKL